ncbi:hypothetical protein BJY16_005625 [Actinoplanes octamycinicus]|uniref:Uncharacterized protein n=1 Tax=Actinoplanes octamycinicus TaxID=135948 RepID=A0A7W7H1C6_9ACTN|nr:hypothetical protein [Actinoplanes octamycinicus]MBB4742166.1 hypothetical protein [Actinoplanes octamycinicus]GIE59988.1 hypothetical protein Aoc01nite_53900 [Actinoplanes octamycinicus]
MTMIIGSTATASSVTTNNVITIKAATTNTPFTSGPLNRDGDDQDERDANSGPCRGSCRKCPEERAYRSERASEPDKRDGEAGRGGKQRELPEREWRPHAGCRGCGELQHANLLAIASFEMATDPGLSVHFRSDVGPTAG